MAQECKQCCVVVVIVVEFGRIGVHLKLIYGADVQTIESQDEMTSLLSSMSK